MIHITRCSKSFPSRNGGPPIRVVERLDLAVADREFVCVLGPSGCGKTTLLWMLAGLVRPDEGEIVIDGRRVTGPGHDRAVVFQDFALLPWVDVLGNIAFGLEVKRVAKDARLARARELAEAVGLHGFEHHYPRELSGGMQQRVSLARALAVDPSILLMDEPFGALDSQTRRTLQEDLLALHARTRRTVVFITHSIDEAVRLGDRIVLLTPRPARIAEIVSVDLPRPRPPDLGVNPAFSTLKEYLWGRVKAQQIAKSGGAGD